MKQLLLSVTLTLAAFTCFSQKYMDKMAAASCDCLAELPDSLDQNTKNIKLGLCMIEVATPYTKELKRDHDIDLANVDVEGERLGKLVGLHMVSICPDALMQFANNSTANTPSQSSPQAQAKVETSEVTGSVLQVNSDYFVSFYIKDDNGISEKYYWLTPVETNFDLNFEYTSLKGQIIYATYIVQNFFDPKIGEYRSFKVIQSLSVIPPEPEN